ncbi:SAM-dependent methyltransferase [Mucilaginibacter hurinus]|uniref:SAM-dependent methyltransferase n=1 Tax=Mucilaginibacter hurinus TaxID=2201324 RepID=A0A367GPR0_9SPHI|nr:class I SAM-dependent methyltransferase [Mucilaginibacter hurinus]RCH55270.1 SAM-dependent methyltransferase [Mucilaginibacter hurinus]
MKNLQYLLLFFVIVSSAAFAQTTKNTTAYTQKTPSSDGTGKWYKGREIAPFMDFAGAAWLERNTRNKEENTDRAIARLPLQSNSVIADIGAGTGYYTFRIADKVPAGRVYAVEIQDEALAYLKNRAGQRNLKNVTVIKGADKSPNLPVNAIDVVIMVDVYHELSYPSEMLQAIHRSLKEGGKLVLLEYRAEDPKVAIKPLHKMTVEQVNKELAANRFKLVQKEDFLPMQHYLVYQKQAIK